MIKNTKIIGSRGGGTPKLILDNFMISDNDYFIVEDSPIPQWQTAVGIGFTFGGYSGSMIFNKNYINTNNEVGLTLIDGAGISDHGYKSLTNVNNFKTYFNTSINYPPDTNSSISEYFTANSFYSLFNSEFKYFYRYDEFGKIISILGSENFHWYPSMDNKEKCPSIVLPYKPCDFNIYDYVEINNIGDSICITINEIPANKFPDSTNIPKGFRIYHNFGEQKTIYWNSFQSGNDITFPITFCISKCELLDMLSIGRDGIEIAIDFYDENGNVYNNTGCDDLIIEYQYPKFCDLFSVDIEKINTEGNCCTYEVKLEINFDLELLNDCPNNPNIAKLIDSIYFTNSMDEEAKRLDEMDNIDIDLENGIITFEYTKCTGEISNNSSFKFMISNNGTVCEIDEIDIPFCACDCPEDVNDWVIESTIFEEAPCSDNQCHISAELKIPSMVKDCYINYSIGDGPKLAFPPNGIINFAPPCINKGETKNIQIKLFKTSNDTDPCIIDKSFECPIQADFDECTPDCPNDYWKKQLPFERNIPGCNPNCKMRVYYSTREATCYDPIRYDIQVTRIELFSSNPSSSPNACNGCVIPDKELNKLAVLSIIWRNVMEFEPDKYECDTNWRVIQASCWTQIPIPQWGTPEAPTPYYMLVPCQESGCCAVSIEVCDYVSFKSITQISEVYRESIDCNSTYFNYYDFGSNQLASSQCHDVCEEWLNEINSPSYVEYEKLLLEDKKEESNNFSDFNILISNDYKNLKLKINSNNNSNLKIKVFNLLGEEILANELKVKEGFNQFDINTNNLNSGVYLLSIFYNSQLLMNDKFLIVR